jgi:hypothetical protein
MRAGTKGRLETDAGGITHRRTDASLGLSADRPSCRDQESGRPRPSVPVPPSQRRRGLGLELGRGGLAQAAVSAVARRRGAFPLHRRGGAGRRRVAPRALCAGTGEFASARESAGLVEGVPAHRRDDTPATTLLLDPSNVRELVSMAASAQVGCRPRLPIEWSDYISEVVDPERRRHASALIFAVDRVEGRTGPASLARLLACLEAGGRARRQSSGSAGESSANG